jgi:hypothetical protein
VRSISTRSIPEGIVESNIESWSSVFFEGQVEESGQQLKFFKCFEVWPLRDIYFQIFSRYGPSMEKRNLLTSLVSSTTLRSLSIPFGGGEDCCFTFETLKNHQTLEELNLLQYLFSPEAVTALADFLSVSKVEKLILDGCEEFDTSQLPEVWKALETNKNLTYLDFCIECGDDSILKTYEVLKVNKTLHTLKVAFYLPEEVLEQLISILKENTSVVDLCIEPNSPAAEEVIAGMKHNRKKFREDAKLSLFKRLNGKVIPPQLLNVVLLVLLIFRRQI